MIKKTYIPFLALVVLIASCDLLAIKKEDSVDEPVITDSTLFTDWEIRIPDVNLRSSLEGILGKQFGVITYGDLKNRTQWDLRKKSITNLTGIEYCSGAETIFIGNNSISDITPLTRIPGLTAIPAANNRISIISPILALSILRVAWFPGNPLDLNDLSILTPTNFPEMNSICFDGRDESTNSLIISLEQAISLLSPFKSQLKRLGLWRIPMEDSGFSTLYNEVISSNAAAYVQLEITGSQITNSSFAMFNNLTELTSIAVWDNLGITDLSLISNLVKLKEAYLSSTRPMSLTPLKDLYDAGAFRAAGSTIEITNCSMDLRTGTSDRDVVNYLISGGVKVLYTTGNTVD